MFSPDYKKATNKAYEILLNYNLIDLPIDLHQIVKLLPPSIHVKTYSDLMARFYLDYDELLVMLPSEKGFFACDLENGNFLIYYNDFRDITTIRFTIAHELGHFFLGHIEDNSSTDKEANCFARNLLSPCPVIDFAQLKTPESISLCCGISEAAADVRLKLKRSDHYWASRDLYQALANRFDCELIYMLYA